MIGDAIFHCHLYSHFHEGMWTLWRVFDRLQDDKGIYPDRTSIEALMPLKDRPFPPATLHNLFDPKKPIKYHDYPSVPLEFPHEPGNRVSLSPQFLKYEPVFSSGINVGYNAAEQTVAPEDA